MKFLHSLSPLFLACILLAACGGQNTDRAVKRDFARYQAQLARIIPIETGAIEAHKKITDDPAMNDAMYARFLSSTFIPQLERFYAELTRIHPTTDELIGLHRLYLKRTALLIASFKELEKAGRTGTADAIERGRAKSDESKAYLKKWKTQMEALEKQYGE